MPLGTLKLKKGSRILTSPEMQKEIDEIITRDIEILFGIVGKKDVEFEIDEPAVYSRGANSAELKIEYTEYSKKEDFYNQGKSFKPSKKTREKLIQKIKQDYKVFCYKHNLDGSSIGVWVMPYRGTSYG